MMRNSGHSAAGAARRTAGSLGEESEMPARRAFVVQLNGDSAIADGQFAGRIEHVVSGQRWRFDSLAELTAFISQAVLKSEK